MKWSAEKLNEQLSKKKVAALEAGEFVVDQLLQKVNDEMIHNTNLDYFATELYFEITSWRNNSDFEVKLVGFNLDVMESVDYGTIFEQISYEQQFKNPNLEVYVFLNALESRNIKCWLNKRDKKLVVSFEVKAVEVKDIISVDE